MLNTLSKPSIWLLIAIVGLPQLSETVYTPALPDISSSLETTDSLVEFTLTIYLFGFAIGTLFWGRLSDIVGRKPSLLSGLIIYVIGCIGCYLSESITALMICRFVQAYGGSAGSVLGQAICRDAFSGSERNKVFASIGSALSLAPAIGPIIGGMIDEQFGWSAIFIALIAAGLIVLYFTNKSLVESHSNTSSPLPLAKVALSMIRDPHVIGSAIIVASYNGIAFSYFAEGPFFLIEMLGLSPLHYGYCFIVTAFGTLLGAQLTKKLSMRLPIKTIMKLGIVTVLLGALIFSSSLIIALSLALNKTVLISITISNMFIIMLGIGILGPSTLSQALINYQHAVGTASSLFGCVYYVLIALFTFGMGSLHNDTLIPMPFYFSSISLLMLLTYKVLLTEKATSQQKSA